MRLLRSFGTVFRYVGVLLVLLAGVYLAGEGFQQDDAARVVAGALIAFAATVWAIVGRARGGDLVP